MLTVRSSLPLFVLAFVIPAIPAYAQASSGPFVPAPRAYVHTDRTAEGCATREEAIRGTTLTMRMGINAKGAEWLLLNSPVWKFIPGQRYRIRFAKLYAPADDLPRSAHIREVVLDAVGFNENGRRGLRFDRLQALHELRPVRRVDLFDGDGLASIATTTPHFWSRFRLSDTDLRTCAAGASRAP